MQGNRSQVSWPLDPLHGLTLLLHERPFVRQQDPTYQEGQACDHANGHSPSHQKMRGSEVVKVPEEEGFYEAPECSGKHDEGKEDHDLGIPDDADHVVQDPLA